MKQKKTKADVIRAALAKNPETKISDIAKMLGCKPQEIYMVRYHDKKRASKKAGAANKTPKRVAIKKRGTWSPTPATPTPDWAKPKPAETALKAKVEEIKAREPDHGDRLSRKEVVVLAIIVFCLLQVGLTIFNPYGG